MSTASVSIALCTFNGERHLEAQLRSLLALDWPELEIVIQDDASSDGTVALVERVAAGDARVRLEVNPRNLGFLANFERALSRCRGDWIAPCDQDDVWHPDKLRRLAPLMADHVLAYADSRLVDAQGRDLGRRLSQVYRMADGDDCRVFTFWNSVSGHALLMRRELLAHCLPFPPGVKFHDWWIAFQAARTGRIAYLDEVLVDYRQHAATQTDTLQARRGERPSQRIYREREAWLQAIAACPGPQQPLLTELAARWSARRTRWWSPGLARLVWRHGEVLMRINRRESPLRFALKCASKKS
jgi:glycosyltransferase involved in cell wall biosynthesis